MIRHCLGLETFGQVSCVVCDQRATEVTSDFAIVIKGWGISGEIHYGIESATIHLRHRRICKPLFSMTISSSTSCN
jgi:hypothetical protein